MGKMWLSWILIAITSLSSAQINPHYIKEQEVQRIVATLSADSMLGRQAFTAGSEKGMQFIRNEFERAGLQPLDGNKDYIQTFSVVSPKLISVFASFNGHEIDSNNIIAFTCLPDLTITEKSGYKKVPIGQSQDLLKTVDQLDSLKENVLFFIDPSLARTFYRLQNRKQYLFKSNSTAVFVLGTFDAVDFVIKAKHKIKEYKASNVIEVLPGRSKKK